MRYLVLLALAAFLLLGTAAACDSNRDKAREAAQNLSEDREGYIPVNDIEGTNFNDRLKLADDPTTILWCTFFPPTTGQQPFTVPITGKLTSSGKRPYDDASAADPQGMFGTSVEYRYGFDPTRGIYYDFTGLPSFCTNEPTVWQANSTKIVVDTAADLISIQQRAQDALRGGNAQGAQDILQGAER